MTDPLPIRQTYLSTLDIDPDSIPGQACLRGEWDQAPGLRDMLEKATPHISTNPPEAEGE